MRMQAGLGPPRQRRRAGHASSGGGGRAALYTPLSLRPFHI
eukprot:COSAG01_NODE_38039_length_495_cov_0.914141_2_plen_40_part_01